MDHVLKGTRNEKRDMRSQPTNLIQYDPLHHLTVLNHPARNLLNSAIALDIDLAMVILLHIDSLHSIQRDTHLEWK